MLGSFHLVVRELVWEAVNLSWSRVYFKRFYEVKASTDVLAPLALTINREMLPEFVQRCL
jgi:hypothetical protein